MADSGPSPLRGVFSLPFVEQEEFFTRKLHLPTQRWDDIQQSAHDRAFVVAGAAKADLLADLHAAIIKAKSGGGLAEFRKSFDEIVARHGWAGWTGEDSAAGRDWRTRIIYETNLRTSYAAGRFQQLQEGGFQYWMYLHSHLVQNPRAQHLAWHGLVLPADHPFWRTHYPPNGWGCCCRVVGINHRDDARALGGDPDLALPADWAAIDAKTGAPLGIGKGWGYAPGANANASLRELVEKKLISYPPAIRRALEIDLATVLKGQAERRAADNAGMGTTIAHTFTAQDFPAFVRGEVAGERPIAAASEEIRRLLGAEAKFVLLSRATAVKQFREHPDITPEDYARVQDMLDQGELLRDRSLHLGIIQEQEKWFYAVIKTTKTGKAIFLQSLRRSNPVDIDVIRARSEIVRPAK